MITRREALAAAVAVVSGSGARYLAPAQSVDVGYWDGWTYPSPQLPIVFGVIDDALLSKPPYYRAHEMSDVYDMFDGRPCRLELITR